MNGSTTTAVHPASKARRAEADGDHTVSADPADGGDELDVSGRVVYRVQLEDDSDDYQRVNDAIAAIEAGEEDEQLQWAEQQRDEADERQRPTSRASTGANHQSLGAISQYEQLRLRVQQQFEEATETVKRTVANSERANGGSIHAQRHDTSEAGERASTSLAPSTLSSSSAAASAALTATPSGDTTSRSLAGLTNLPLSDWLSTGRPLPLQSVSAVAWQRELEAQCALAVEPQCAVQQQPAHGTVWLSDVLPRAASYRQALSKLAASVSCSPEALLAANSRDRLAVDATLHSMQRQRQQQCHKVQQTRPSPSARRWGCVSLNTPSCLL